MKALENGLDERLLVEAAQQDPRHFAKLYEKNFERVYAFVARRVRDRDAAEDLTAEVFHQALATLGRFEWRGAPFAGWLLGIAAHLIADYWQRASTRQKVPAEDLDEAGADDDAEGRALIGQLVDMLPDDQRLVIVRRFVEQRSIREIAQELGRSEGAIKQLQFRALQSLRARLRSNHG